MEFPPSVASEGLLIILSAVSPFAELLSGEIKTFVNFTAQQWCWVTTWEEKQEWAGEGAGGAGSCLNRPARHSGTEWASTSELALQVCRPPAVQATLSATAAQPRGNVKRVPYTAQGCYHVAELKDPN